MDVLAIAKKLEVSVDDFHDAVFQIQSIESDVGQIITTIRERQEELCVARFKEGAIIHTLCELTGETTKTVRAISEQTGISEAILWDCRRLYQRPEWGGSVEALRQWLSERERKMSWTHLRHWLNNQRRKTERSYFASKIESLERRAIKLEEDAMQVETEMDAHARGEQLIAGKGVVAKIKQIREDGFGRVHETLMKKGGSPPRDAEYLKYVRSLPCCVTGVTKDIVVHHVLTGGKATKCSDYATVPMNAMMHGELHNIGRKSFEEKYEINFWEQMAQNLSVYFTGRPLK